MTGKTNSVKTVAIKSPLAIAVAIGAQKIFNINGNIPSIAAAAVNIIGRKRNTAESIIAS